MSKLKLKKGDVVLTTYPGGERHLNKIIDNPLVGYRFKCICCFAQTKCDPDTIYWGNSLIIYSKFPTIEELNQIKAESL